MGSSFVPVSTELVMSDGGSNESIICITLSLMCCNSVFSCFIWLLSNGCGCPFTKRVILSILLHCIANDRSESSKIVIRSLSSSLYLSIISSLFLSLPLYTLCIINISSSYVISSLWIGILLISSPSWALMISLPLKSIVILNKTTQICD